MSPREIDALVAEHCMGFRECAGHWLDNRGGWHRDLAFFRPSTDPAASKQLRDKMRADGWRFTMYDQKDSMVFAQFIRNDDQGFLTPCESADTEEMATALAALDAKGHPIKEEKP